MPLISTLGAASSRGFGEFNQQATGKYIEDYFSTWLYTGNGTSQTIRNGIGLADTAAWSSYQLQQNQSFGRGVAIDSSGNIYIVGYANDGTNDYIVIAKYNSSGVIQWQRKLKQNNSYGLSISTDLSGNIYIVGYANDGTTDYIIIAKYNSSGAIQWQRRLNQSSSQGYGIATDSSGNVYVAGNCNDGSFNYIITAKYNSSGAIQWQRKLQQNNSTGYGIATDSSGNVYIVGNCNDGSLNYIITAKYNSSGAIQWQRKLQQNNSIGYGIATDSSGNVYIVGNCNDGSFNYIITAKYNSSGAVQWQRKLQQNGSDGYGITTDSSGNVYVTGRPNDGSFTYIIAAKYNSSGSIQWQRKLQQNNSTGYGITTDSSGGVYVIGRANNGLNYIVTSKLTTDGSTSSGIAFVTLQIGSATESAAGATDSAGGATDSAGGATDSAAGATDSAGTATSSTDTQAAVTGAGGLVWMKGRSGATDHALYDTARGATFELISNSIDTQTTQATGLTAFTASGFSIGSLAKINTSSATYASWTWRETPKFFDIVTYTGTGSARTISHNLGSEPGMMIIKKTIGVATEWAVYHRSLLATQALQLEDTTAAFTATNFWNSTRPTNTVFSLGAGGAVNASGATFVAYLFAHNAGGFGLDGSQNVISCGSFTTSGTGTATVTLGYEPQFILVKSSTSARNWRIFDTMRGWVDGGAITTADDAALFPNLSNAETNAGGGYPTSTGFTYAELANDTYIYMAIRRGPMKVPTDGTTVYAPIAYNGNSGTITATTNFPVDLSINANRSHVWSADTFVFDRLRGSNQLRTNQTAQEFPATTFWFDSNTSTRTNISSLVESGYTFINWAFRRAPSFMDVVCVTAFQNGTLINHNLGAAPELIFAKNRTPGGGNWMGFANIGGTAYGHALNVTTSFYNSGLTASTYITSTTIDPIAITNAGGGAQKGSNSPTVLYLFATCPGVSKVGSYTGTGATQTISCGFTGGARYVLIKRTDSTGDWWVWDTARGMVAGTDPRLAYNSTAAETNANWVYTTTGGFQIVTSDATVNASGGTYIYLAIA